MSNLFLDAMVRWSDVFSSEMLNLGCLIMPCHIAMEANEILKC